MNLPDQTDKLNPRFEECLRLRRCWLWFLILGIALMVVGAMAIGAAFIAGLAFVLTLGILLLAGGVVQIVNAFLARSWKGFFLHLLAGILHLVVGMLIIERPGRALAVIALLLAVAFLAGGLVRIVYALLEDFSGRGWVLLNGLITLVLGIIILRRWPESSEWVVGLLVGIDLIFNGWSWVMLGLIVKSSVGGHQGTGASLPPRPESINPDFSREKQWITRNSTISTIRRNANTRKNSRRSTNARRNATRASFIPCGFLWPAWYWLLWRFSSGPLF